MVYASPADIRKAIAPQSAWANTAATMTDAELQDQELEAAAIVDGYLALRYTTPLPVPIPQLVRGATRSVAAYLATLTYRRAKDLTPEDPIALRYQSALSVLERLAAGAIALPGNGTGGEGSDDLSGDVTVVNTYTGTLFPLTEFESPESWGVTPRG